MIFDIYLDAAGEWRWRAVARNGRVVADSAEGYTQKGSAKRAAQAFIAQTIENVVWMESGW